MRHPRFENWTIICWFVLAVLLGLGWPINYYEGKDLRDNAVRTSAAVIAVNHNKAVTWDLSFTDQNGQPQKVGGTQNVRGVPKVGDHVEIYYSPNDPTNEDEVIDVRFGKPGGHQLSIARKLGLLALIPLALGSYGLVIRVRDEQREERLHAAN